MSKLVLEAGPRLLRLRPRARNSVKAFQTESCWSDVTEAAHEYLFEPVELRGTVTVRNIFLLLERCPFLLSVFRRDYACEMLDYLRENGLLGTFGIHTCDLTHLELYQVWHKNSHTGCVRGQDFWHLRGWGPPEPGMDWLEPCSEAIPYSVSLTDIAQLLDVSLRVSLTAQVVEDDEYSVKYGEVLHEVCLESISLGDVIRGLLWELSFHGSPQDQQKVVQELRSQVAELDTRVEESCSKPPARLRRFIFRMNRRERQAYTQVFGPLSKTWSAPRIRSALSKLDDALNAHEALYSLSNGMLGVVPQLRHLSARDLREYLAQLKYAV